MHKGSSAPVERCEIRGGTTDPRRRQPDARRKHRYLYRNRENGEPHGGRIYSAFVTDQMTSREELKRIWRAAGGDTIGFYINAEAVLRELEQYPAAILRRSADENRTEAATAREDLGAWL